jgi:hypothetical protein
MGEKFELGFHQALDFWLAYGKDRRPFPDAACLVQSKRPRQVIFQPFEPPKDRSAAGWPSGKND